MESILLPHNIPVYEQLENTIATHNRALIVTTTGSGKSYITLEYVTKHNAKTLVVVPKINIGHQWTDLSPLFEFVTYHSFGKRKDINKYDVIVFDEAHHCGSVKWGPIIKDFVSNSNQTIIGLTADPKRWSDGAKDVGEMLWPDSRVDGYSLDEAIETGVLPKFTYVSAFYNLSEVKSKYSNKNIIAPLMGRFNYAMKNCNKVTDIIKSNIPKDSINSRKGILFVQSIKNVDEGIKLINKIFKNMPVWVVHSKQSAIDNDHYITQFRNAKKGFIVAVDMFNEGLHAKGINTVIMLRRTESPSVFFQQIGRAMSTDNTDNDVYIFDLVTNAMQLKIKATTREVVSRCILSQNNSIPSDQVIIKDYTREIIDVLDDIDKYLSKNWSKHENEILRKYYPIEGRNVYKRLPGRTMLSCKRQAMVLNLHHDVSWTNEEDEILKTYYPTEGSAVIKRLESRTLSSIRNRVNTLNLTYVKTDVYTDEEIEILKKYYPIERQSTYKRLPGRSKESVITKAVSLGLTKSKSKKYTDEEIEFIKNNSSKGAKYIAEKLGRSKASINRKMQECCKTRPRIDWTEDEDNILRTYYPLEGTQCFDRLENRSYAACANRAHRLGLKL